MSSSDLIQGLVITAEPVQRRRVGLEVLALVGIALLQIVGAAVYFGMPRLDAAFGTDGPRMIAKIGLFGAMAAAFSGLAIASMSPAAARFTRPAAAVLAVLSVIGIATLDRTWGTSLQGTLHPQFGMRCLVSIWSLALPVTLLLALFMTRGASVRPGETAVYVGLAGGAWGAFTYAIQCPFVSVYYLGLWYVGGVAIVALATWLILPRLARW